MFAHLSKLNLQQWIEADKERWGRRQTVWQDSDFIVVVHRGPNRGKQFHINEGDEIFYQLDGELQFHYINASGKRELMTLNQGEMFLLPANVPHSPRFCENCDNKLYEAAPRSGEGPNDKANFSVEETNQRFKTDFALRTCKRCGEILQLEE